MDDIEPMPDPSPLSELEALTALQRAREDDDEFAACVRYECRMMPTMVFEGNVTVQVFGITQTGNRIRPERGEPSISRLDTQNEEYGRLRIEELRNEIGRPVNLV